MAAERQAHCLQRRQEEAGLSRLDILVGGREFALSIGGPAESRADKRLSCPEMRTLTSWF